jgi:hypothetical protein
MRANHHAWLYAPPDGRGRDGTARFLAWCALAVGVVNIASICYTTSHLSLIRGHVERLEERRAGAPRPDPPRIRAVHAIEEGLEARMGGGIGAWEGRP